MIIQWTFLGVGQDERAEPYRSKLWKEAYGNVLEVGPGFSASLKHLQHKTTKDSNYVVDPDVIHSYTALEPNPFMYGGLQENAEKVGFCVDYDHDSYPECTMSGTEDPHKELVPFKIVRGTLDNSNNIPQAILDGAPYDTVLTSFVLCTSTNREEFIRNIVRLLKPGGTYLFIEHIRHPTPGNPLVIEDNGVNGRFWGKMQDWLNPIWNIFGQGCHITRDLGEDIANIDGWESVDYKMVRVNATFIAYFVPMAFGKAIKA
ncbi:hypothetical protein H4R20_003695 [Coemansia guatemalensis]|uniref:Methyltransferase type 11 domain-containing protein n=1 Tax=Coemansia guatemalensis TaxID=2761395 RepID=A0A9W8HZ22_9FUNG|nr:hypothetical protein H4R20_003695 [Coemansia guatemalensis]